MSDSDCVSERSSFLLNKYTVYIYIYIYSDFLLSPTFIDCVALCVCSGRQEALERHVARTAPSLYILLPLSFVLLRLSLFFLFLSKLVTRPSFCPAPITPFNQSISYPIADRAFLITTEIFHLLFLILENLFKKKKQKTKKTGQQQQQERRNWILASRQPSRALHVGRHPFR